MALDCFPFPVGTRPLIGTEWDELAQLEKGKRDLLTPDAVIVKAVFLFWKPFKQFSSTAIQSSFAPWMYFSSYCKFFPATAEPPSPRKKKTQKIIIRLYTKAQEKLYESFKGQENPSEKCLPSSTQAKSK